MVVLLRTVGLLLAGALIGLISNEVRSDGVLVLAFAPPTECDATAQVVALPPSVAQELCADASVLVVDVRPHALFERGHVPGALHLPCQRKALTDDALAQLDGASSILVYGQSTMEAAAVADSLSARKLAVQVLDGGYPAWEAAGMACSSGPCEHCVGALNAH